MRRFLIAIAILIAPVLSRGEGSALRSRAIDCDLSALSFRLTKDQGAPEDLMPTWDKSQAAWIDQPIDVTGNDVMSIRVIEQPSLIFGPSSPNVRNPNTGLLERPVVPAVKFVFSADGVTKLDRVARPRLPDPDQGFKRSVGIAVFLGKSLFLAVQIPPYPKTISKEQIVELPRNDFDQIVEFIETALGCRKAAA